MNNMLFFLAGNCGARVLIRARGALGREQGISFSVCVWQLGKGKRNGREDTFLNVS